MADHSGHHRAHDRLVATGLGDHAVHRRHGQRGLHRQTWRADAAQRERERELLAGRSSSADALTASGQLAGDIGGAQAEQGFGVELQVGRTGDRREGVGVGDAEDGAALGGREGAQADAVGQVRVKAAQPALLKPLGSQQQVNGEGAAESADHHEQVDEVRPAGQQFGELVDDDQQRGQRDQVRAVHSGLLVVADGGEVAGRPQQFLAPVDLAVDRVAHPVDQGEVVGEVGDHRAGVREFGHAGEGGATLEVDQRQVDRLGRVRRGQAGDQGAEQFALAGTGRADHQAVRAHAALGRLLQVQFDRSALGVDADRDAQPVARRAALPGDLGVQVAGVADAEQTGQAQRVRHRRLGHHRRGAVERGQLAGQGFRRGGVDPITAAQQGDPLLVVGADNHADLAVRDVQAQRVRQWVARRRVPAHVDHGHRVPTAARHQHRFAGQVAAVHDDHQVPVVEAERGGLGEQRPFAEIRSEQVGERGQVVRDQPRGAGRVGAAVLLGRCRLGVRQPFGPFPLRVPVHREAQADAQVVGGVEGGELGEQRAHQVEHLAAVTADVELRERAQRHRDRQVGDGRVGADEMAQRGRGDRVEVLQRRGLRGAQRRGQALRAGADAHAGEVRVVAAALPQPAALDHRPEVRRVGLRGDQRGPLIFGDLADLLPQTGEIALVVPPLLVDLRLLRGAAARQRHDDHAEHGGREQRAEDVGHGAAAATDVDERHRAHAEHHRQEEQHLHGARVGALGQQRRRLQQDLAGRRLRHRGATFASRGRRWAAGGRFGRGHWGGLLKPIVGIPG